MNRPAETADEPAPRCARCGSHIYDDQPAWLETATGERRPSSLWNLDAGARLTAARAWHVACFAAEHYKSDAEPPA